MANTKKADSGCFSAVLRRLLCGGSLQTYPTDQIPEPKEPELVDKLKTEAKLQNSVTPGVVARLMGLDSLPESDLIGKAKTTPDLVTRSRSVNFMDYMLEFDTAKFQSRHRRVRTSVSFREIPTLLDRQNDVASVVTYFNKEDQKEEEKNKKKENERKSKKEIKFRDEPRRGSSVRKNSKKEIHGGRESGIAMKKKSAAKKPVHYQREVLPKPKVSKKKNNQNRIKEVAKAESVAENLSPVSVLDFNEFSFCNHAPWPDRPEYSSHQELNSESKSSLKSPDHGDQSLHSTGILTKDDFQPMETKENQNTDYNYIELITKIRRFTAETMMQSNWVPKKELNFDDFEEICLVFGQHILDHLLQQVVHELVGLN